MKKQKEVRSGEHLLKTVIPSVILINCLLVFLILAFKPNNYVTSILIVFSIWFSAYLSMIFQLIFFDVTIRRKK